MPEYPMINLKKKYWDPSFSRIINPVLGCFGRKLSGNPQLQPTTDVLPPEIWTHIFHLVCNDALEEQLSVTHGYGGTPSGSKSHLTPVLLSQVCRDWKAMITSDPLFWDSIFVNPCSRSSVVHLTAWLARSQSMPVSIYLEAISFDSDKDWRVDNCDVSPLKACIKIVHQHSWHIESLSLWLFKRFLDVWTNMLGQTSEAEPLPDFQSVGILVIKISHPSECTYSRSGDDTLIEQQFLSALTSRNPSIKSLTLQDCYRYRNPPILFQQLPLESPRLSGLVSLTLKDLDIMNVPSFVRILAHARLRALSLVAVRFGGEHLADSVLTILPSIQELHLQIVTRKFPETNRTPKTTNDVSNFARCVRFPDLISLEVDLNVYGWESILEHCTIRRLTLWDTLSFGSTAWKLLSLEKFNGLEELTLKPHIWMHHDMIRLVDGSERAFGYPNDDQASYHTPMLPKELKRLVMHGCVVEGVDGLLAEVAQSRMQKFGLEYLYVEVKGLHPDKNLKDIEAFKELRKLGYQAHLRSTPQSVIQCTDNYMTEKAYEFIGYLDIPSFRRELGERVVCMPVII